MARTWPDDGAWRLVQACRLIEKKGLQTSLRAFARFAEKYPAARFTVAGDGPQLASLQALAAELGIAEKVSFAGMLRQKDLRDLFEQSHLFLHPSQLGSDGNQEGVPNSMLEAMASGLPVFATTHGGIPEAIEDGTSGLLVPEQDHAELARVLLETVPHPERLAEIATAGAATVREHFENRTQVRRLEDFYLETLPG